jgi:hypothetical protein
MKFRVTGENVGTAARMAMEIEASSKAEAERKAAAAGMKVHHAMPLSDDPSVEPRRHKRAAGVHPVVKLAVLLALLAAGYVVLWPRLQSMLRQ